MAAITAAGTTLTYDSQLLGDVTSISAPSVSISTIEATDLDSTWKTFIAGLRDGGDVTFELNYNPSGADHQALLADIGGGGKDFTITWSDLKTTTGNGIITSFTTTAGMDDKLTASVTLKVTGAVTFPVA